VCLSVCLSVSRARWPSPGTEAAGGAQRSISFGRPRQWMGGALWAGSSQLVAFEASPTAVGEGQPRVVGSRPGAGRGRKGPHVP
jgi:hypothetical protein